MFQVRGRSEPSLRSGSRIAPWKIGNASSSRPIVCEAAVRPRGEKTMTNIKNSHFGLKISSRRRNFRAAGWLLFPTLIFLCTLCVSAVSSLALATVGQVTTSQPNLSTVVPKGADPTGVKDSAPAIRAAIATGNDVHIPAGTYLVSSFDTPVFAGSGRAMFWLQNNQKITFAAGAKFKVGNGVFTALYAGGQVGYVFFGNIVSHVTIQDAYIDMNGANNLCPVGASYYPSYAIFFEAGSYNSVLNSTILNTPGENAIVTSGSAQGVWGSYFTVKGSTIINGGSTLSGNVNLPDWSAIYSEANHTIFQNNKILASSAPASIINAGGMEIHNSFSEATGNKCQNTYPCFYIAASVANMDITDVDIHNNDMESGIIFVSFTPQLGGNFRRIKIQQNTVNLSKNAAFSTKFPWGISELRTDNGLYTYLGVIYDSD